MAKIATTMDSLGHPHEACSACKEPIPRGARMLAVEADDGTALGWICTACRDEWVAGGAESRTASALVAG